MGRGISKERQSQTATNRQKPTAAKPGPASNLQTHNGGTSHLGRAELLCAAIVFVAALLLYIWTLAPTVALTDSGELIVVARGLGVAHPPGFPLWIILAHLASLVPIGNVAMRINFSSALFAALACAMLTLVVAEMMITASYLAAAKRRKKGTKKTEELGVTHLVVAGPA